MTYLAVDRLVSAALAVPDVVRAAYDGVPGHPVVLPCALFGDIARLKGDVGARDLIGDRAVLVEVGDLANGLDVDTQQNLERVRDLRGYKWSR